MLILWRSVCLWFWSSLSQIFVYANTCRYKQTCVLKKRRSIKRDTVPASLAFWEKESELGLLGSIIFFWSLFSVSSFLFHNFRFREALKLILASWLTFCGCLGSRVVAFCLFFGCLGSTIVTSWVPFCGCFDPKILTSSVTFCGSTIGCFFGILKDEMLTVPSSKYCP